MLTVELSCPGLTGASSTPRRLPCALSWLLWDTGSPGQADPVSSLRAQAKQSRGPRRVDCFVAIAPRNDVTPKTKGEPKARRSAEILFRPHLVPGRSEAPPGLEGYFFFDFLAFFAFFAFFAFLAIASSFGLMDGNATRGMLGGGPASQHPRM
jgi:hypothetical protein